MRFQLIIYMNIMTAPGWVLLLGWRGERRSFNHRHRPSELLLFSHSQAPSLLMPENSSNSGDDIFTYQKAIKLHSVNLLPSWATTPATEWRPFIQRRFLGTSRTQSVSTATLSTSLVACLSRPNMLHERVLLGSTAAPHNAVCHPLTWNKFVISYLDKHKIW